MKFKLLDYFNDMKKQAGYKKCSSEDLDPFQNCKPVNCEEKYFGKRNFFKDSLCVPAALCDDGDLYDYETNECTNRRNILSEAEMNEMQSGTFSNWEQQEEGRTDDEPSIEVSEL